MILIHPKHGSKICFSDSEARTDIANGWEIASEIPSKAIAKNVEAEIESISNDFADEIVPSEPEIEQEPALQPYQQYKKRGPKPKYKG